MIAYESINGGKNTRFILAYVSLFYLFFDDGSASMSPVFVKIWFSRKRKSLYLFLVQILPNLNLFLSRVICQNIVRWSRKLYVRNRETKGEAKTIAVCNE